MNPTKTAGLAATACLALTAALALATPAQASAAEGTYVALGDSYTAVGTLTSPAPGTPSLCLQDADNYPHVVARASGCNSTTSVAPARRPAT